MPIRAVQMTEDTPLRTKALRLILGRMAFLLLLLMANLWRSTVGTDGGATADGVAIAFALAAGLRSSTTQPKRIYLA